MTNRPPVSARMAAIRFLLVVIVIAGVTVWLQLREDGPNPSSRPRAASLAASAEPERPSQRYVEGQVGVTLSEADMDRFNQLVVAGDDLGTQQMVLAGRVIIIPERTACTVIDLGFSTSEVRLTEGRYAGQAVFVASHLIEGL